MRLTKLAPVLALSLALVFAGCIKDDPVDAATEEGVPPAEETAPVDPTPATPATAPPPASSQPPASSSPPPPPEPPAPPPPPPAPRITVYAWNGSLTAAGIGAAAPTGHEVCCAQAAPANENADVEFDVESGLKGIVVELVWTDPQFDLDLIVTASDYDVAPTPPDSAYTGHRWYAGEGTPAQPEGHAAIAITDADALAVTGAWMAHASAKGPANAVAFTLLVSLFYDEAPASGYTAASS